MPDSPPRKSWPFYLGLALVMFTLPVGYFFFLGRRAPPAPAPAPATLRPMELHLGQVEGLVELRREDGGWSRARSGERVELQDGVRTGPDGSAQLLGGDTFEVRVERSTEVGVAELSDSISRLLLQSGMATARVRGRGRHTFEVKAVGSDALARTRDGAFAISNNGRGTVAVGTREGEVELLGHDQVVIVRAGEQSIVRPGQPPSAPAPVPGSLLLKVSLPATLVVNRRKVVVAGEVEPGAVVDVAGQPAVVDERGKFSVPLDLSEGRSQVEVRARSVGGRDGRSAHTIEVDTRVNRTSIEQPDWKTPAR